MAITFPFRKIVRVGDYVLDLWASWKVTKSHEERLRERTTGKGQLVSGGTTSVHSLLNSVH